MYLTKIDLATQRQLVIDLKIELQKTKEAAQLAKEAVILCARSVWKKCKLGSRRSF